MQRHPDVERVTRMVWRSLLYRKCILRRSATGFQRESLSMLHVGCGCPATSPNSSGPWPLGAMCIAELSLHFRVAICVHHIECWVIACQYLIIGFSKLPYNNIFAKGLNCGFWLPPADNISPKGQTGLHSDTIWFDREYIACHIGVIGLLWFCFLLLAPPVGDIRYPKCPGILHWVVVVIIEISTNLPPVLWRFRRWIQIEPCGGQSVCCAIALSRCHVSHIVRH